MKSLGIMQFLDTITNKITIDELELLSKDTKYEEEFYIIKAVIDVNDELEKKFKDTDILANELVFLSGHKLEEKELDKVFFRSPKDEQ